MNEYLMQNDAAVAEVAALVAEDEFAQRQELLAAKETPGDRLLHVVEKLSKRGVAVSRADVRPLKEHASDISQLFIDTEDIIGTTENVIGDSYLAQSGVRLREMSAGDYTMMCNNGLRVNQYVDSFKGKFETEPEQVVVSGVFPHTRNVMNIIIRKKKSISMFNYALSPDGVQKLDGW